MILGTFYGHYVTPVTESSRSQIHDHSDRAPLNRQISGDPPALDAGALGAVFRRELECAVG